MRKAILLGLMAGLLAATLAGPSLAAGSQAKWHPANAPLMTRWAKDVTPDKVRPEYPRPQMVRPNWVNLNGLWDFAITGKGDAKPAAFNKQIMVPFPVESALSGVMQRIEPKDRMWYKRSFTVPSAWKGKRVLLHFGAVDWDTTVYVNGKEIGRHTGGYDPFTFDISSEIKPGAAQEIVLSVWDPSSDGNQPVGKQSLAPGGCFYTPCSGIWQTAWLEAVPQAYIDDFKITPDVDKKCLRVTVNAAGANTGKVTATAFDKGKQVASVSGKPGQELVIPIKNAKLWSPASPYLYDLKLTLQAGASTDKVDSYFAMRKISVGPDSKGIMRLLLNNKFVFQLGPLDQGYWPDGNYSTPSDAAIVYDLKILKDSGFNMIRKHIKVEPARWYYWCDHMGFVVWQDMPCLPVREPNAEAKSNYEGELDRIIGALYNTPSIIMWVPFNEAWGQFDTPRIVEKIRQLDKSRLIDNASGWIDNKVGDVVDIHGYPGPWMVRPEAKRAAVIGEFGGLGMIYKDHIWFKDGWGYDLLQNREALATRYEKLFRDLQPMVKNPGVSAAVYTQVSDIEGEINGLMSYDREVVKIDPRIAMNASKYLFPPTKVGDADKFIGQTKVQLLAPTGSKIHYTTDGSNPTAKSALYTDPIKLEKSTVLQAAAVLGDGSISRVATFDVKKVDPKPAVSAAGAKPGLQVAYYEGDMRNLPDFDKMTMKRAYISRKFDLSRAERGDGFAMKFDGFVTVPTTGVYTFYSLADDCATLIIDGDTIISDPIAHGFKEMIGSAALQAGAHKICLMYSQSSGDRVLRLGWLGPGISGSEYKWATGLEVPASALSFVRTLPMVCLPVVSADYAQRFVGETDASLASTYDDAAIYYTTDSSEPTDKSTRYTGPIHLTATTTIKARAYMDGLDPSAVSSFDYTSETPIQAVANDNVEPGLTLYYYEKGTDGSIPDLSSWTPDKTYKVDSLSLPGFPKSEQYSTKIDGYIRVPKTGAYAFYMQGDDVSRLIVAGKTVIDKAPFFEDPKKGDIVLEAGLHPFTIIHTQGSGASFVKMQIEGPGMSKRDLGPGMLFRSK